MPWQSIFRVSELGMLKAVRPADNKINFHFFDMVSLQGVVEYFKTYFCLGIAYFKALNLMRMPSQIGGISALDNISIKFVCQIKRFIQQCQ